MSPQTSRRRRSAVEGADFRRQLVEVARDLFVTEGFESVSIRKITQRANCPPMTFYVYFKSKRELLHHIWGDVICDARATCARAVDPAAPAKEGLRAFLEALVAYWIAHPDGYRVTYMNVDFAEPPEETRRFSDTLEDGGRLTELEELFVAGVTEGVFRPGDPIEVSQALYSAAMGLAHLQITVPEYAWRRDTLATTMFDLLLRGLERSPPSREA